MSQSLSLPAPEMGPLRRAVSFLIPATPLSTVQFYRLLVIVNGFVPLLMLGWDALRGELGANAVNHALHITGILSLVFLFLSLIVTPLRWFTGWGGWIAFRRALGLYGFFYAVVHLIIYVGFDRAMNLASTVEEIWMRRFLQIGTLAVLLMVPLAVTSTNAMVQKLGPSRWKLLHRLAYLVAILGVVHYYMLVKSDVRQPIAFGVVLAVLLIGRFLKHYFELLQIAKNASMKKPAPRLAATASSPTRLAGPKKPQTPWKGELKIAATFQETSEVRTFRLVAADGGPFPFTYSPGQFLTFQLMIDGKRVQRSYTIASSPTRRDACEVSIKRESMGLGSRHIHDQMKVGDIMKVTAPSGKFTFSGTEAPSIVLIAGGVGITPMMSILRYLTDRAWMGDIYFLIVAKTEQDLIFNDEIQWLKRRHPRLRVCETLTRATPDTPWRGERGRISEAMLRSFVPDLTAQPVYICGPDDMMDATVNLLLSLGIPESLIHTEKFGGKKKDGEAEAAIVQEMITEIATDAPDMPAGAVGEKTISFAKSNAQTLISDETTVLEAAESLSIPLPYECRSGICGQCKSRVLQGKVVMDSEDALTPAEKAKGLILACQARPLTDLVVDA